jgi:hypothetical protein
MLRNARDESSLNGATRRNHPKMEESFHLSMEALPVSSW